MWSSWPTAGWPEHLRDRQDQRTTRELHGHQRQWSGWVSECVSVWVLCPVSGPYMALIRPLRSGWVSKSLPMSSPVTLAFEPVLWWKLICYARTQSHCNILVSTVYLPPGFPRYLFIHQPVCEDEQLGELCADCPCPGLNSGQRICSETS